MKKSQTMFADDHELNDTDIEWCKACFSLAYVKEGMGLIRKNINHLTLLNLVLKRRKESETGETKSE